MRPCRLQAEREAGGRPPRNLSQERPPPGERPARDASAPLQRRAVTAAPRGEPGGEPGGEPVGKATAGFTAAASRRGQGKQGWANEPPPPPPPCPREPASVPAPGEQRE